VFSPAMASTKQEFDTVVRGMIVQGERVPGREQRRRLQGSTGELAVRADDDVDEARVRRGRLTDYRKALTPVC
jgi:hypothetical protein